MNGLNTIKIMYVDIQLYMYTSIHTYREKEHTRLFISLYTSSCLGYFRNLTNFKKFHSEYDCKKNITQVTVITHTVILIFQLVIIKEKLLK